MSIFYFSTCLQRQADKKDLLGLFVAGATCMGGGCCLYAVLQDRCCRWNCPRGAIPSGGEAHGSEALLFFFLFLFFGSWLWCWTRFFMALDARKCLWSNQLFRQQQPSRNALVFCSRLCVWELKALKGGKGVCLNVKCRAFFLGKSLLVFLYAFQLKAESEHAYVWGRAHICAHTVAQVGKKHSCGSHRRNFWWRQQY